MEQSDQDILTELKKSGLSIHEAQFDSNDKLIRLDLRSNGLTQLPPKITQLTGLTMLNLTDNYLTYLPPEISHLTNLTSLSLSYNHLVQLPSEIGQLFNLTELFLNDNDLTRLPQEISQLFNLNVLFVGYNPLEVPPIEVVKKGISSIRNYFRQLDKEGIDYLYEAKLLIVGEAGAGKTTLAKKLKDTNYELNAQEQSTKGINVIQWQFDIFGHDPFRVNIWDFGGQEIYHATHQFFLTKRSLYILVADTRKEDTDFYYWLNVVQLLSNNSPLFIVKNEKQDRQRDINERQLRGEFENLEKTLATNLATNRGLLEIITEIQHYISNLPHVGDVLPKTWLNVRRALENDPRNYIGRGEFLQICQDSGFTELKDKLQLSDYLHDLGVILHFQDDLLLNKIVILKPEWGTTAVYKLLDNSLVINSRGRFNRSDLTQIWHEEQYSSMQAELLQLMMKFRLCYRIPDTEDYIAPQLLTENQPDYNWPKGINLTLRYTYKFVPKGIITQFIVAMHSYIADQQYVWKSGIILEMNKTQAEVIESYGNREIRIRVVGKYKKELLTIVAFQLDRIHRGYPRLQVDKLIPCNCKSCKKLPEPHYYDFDLLREMLLNGKKTIDCYKKPYLSVKIAKLIDDVVSEEELFELSKVDEYKFRRFTKLREQEALQGISIDPAISIEREDLEDELRRKSLY